MDQSIVNAVSPFVGKLHWVGQVSGGESKTTGNPWKRVDFTISYVDAQLQTRYITFSLSGVEKVDRLMQIPIGTTIRVTWRPSGNEYNGRWYPKIDAVGIFVEQVRPQAPAQGYPPQGGQYPPQQGYQQPMQGGYQQQMYHQPAQQGYGGYAPQQRPAQQEDLPEGF